MEIRGIYNQTMFRNEETGLTRFSLVTDACKESRNSRGLLICRGITPVFASGMPLKLEGEIVQSVMGYEFKFTVISPFSDKEQITIDYLTSGAFHGIGEKTARKIVNITGPDIFSFVQKPDAKGILAEEIGDVKIDSLFQTLRNTFQHKQVMDYIRPFGGDYTHAAKITHQCPINSVVALKNNCYQLGMDAGMSFFVCDSIAQHEQYFAYDERRITAMLKVAFARITGKGHTCANIDTLYSEIQNIAKNSAFAESVPKGLIARTAIKDKSFFVDTEKDIFYYLSDMHRAERDLAREAIRIQGHPCPLSYSESIISEIEKDETIIYSSKQKDAFGFLKTTGIKILTGGPGTGKSTVVNGLIKAYKMMNPHGRILLCAPTGRAAQKLHEVTGETAQTIHRAIDVRPFGNEIQYKTLDDPLEYDLIIVDEMSMADITITSMLLGAVPTNSTVILCGDINQLPSVGPGTVLRDMIDSQRFQTVSLDVIYRQAKGSSIISNALNVNSGKNSFALDSQFSVISVKNEEELQKKVVELMRAKYDPRDVFSVQVLSSTKKGKAGTIELNLALQGECNARNYFDPNNTVIQYGQFRYSVGDKIMMTANNYRAGYFNGDIGTITAINSDSITASINGSAVEISKKNLCDLTLALATTIHKSQGSEFPTVIIALPRNPSVMLQRNLLYTAITRAKKNVIIVEEEGAIVHAIKTISNVNRKTHLLEKLAISRAL